MRRSKLDADSNHSGGLQVRSYLSMMTGSEGVSFRFPQLFLSQHRLKQKKKGQQRPGRESLLAFVTIFSWSLKGCRVKLVAASSLGCHGNLYKFIVVVHQQAEELLHNYWKYFYTSGLCFSENQLLSF